MPKKPIPSLDLPDTVDLNDSPSIYSILSDIRGILSDMKDGSGSLSPAMPGDGGRTPVRVVSAPDPENEKLWEVVFELAGLLEQWRRAPVFTDVEKYGAWLQEIGPRVDAALRKVELSETQPFLTETATTKRRKKQ